jgi:hypothetical protein
MMDLQSVGEDAETSTEKGREGGREILVALMVAPDGGIVPSEPSPLPADLARVVAAWPDLPAAVKAGVLAMVGASGG